MPRARNRRFRSSANQGTIGEASKRTRARIKETASSLVRGVSSFLSGYRPCRAGLDGRNDTSVLTAANNHLRVIPDPTPGTHHTGSTDVLYFLPIVGPCTAWLAFHLASHAVANGEHVWSTDTLARLVGLGGNRSKLWASLDHLAYFGLGEFVATGAMTIRLHLPRMADHHLDDSPMHSPSSTGTETSTAER
jgi:hypothetical protein